MKYAIYDLSYQATANSFLTFCIVVKSKCAVMGEECFLIFKKGPNEGFQEPNTAPYSNEEKKFRAAHMLYPICALMGMDYSTDMPPNVKESDILQHENILSLGAILKQHEEGPLVFPQPSKRAIEIIKKEFSEPPVVITLRETFSMDRNSALSEWLKFADYASETSNVVVVRDIYRWNDFLSYEGRKLNTFPTASIDLDVRLALFKYAKMNFSVGGGSTALLRFSTDIPYRTFKYMRTKFSESSNKNKPKPKHITQKDLKDAKVQTEMSKEKKTVILTTEEVKRLRLKLEEEGPQKVVVPTAQGGFTKISIGDPRDKRFKGTATYGSLMAAGFPPGSQFPWHTENQKIIWEEDDFENLKREYDKWAEDYGNFH
jgi:hypothetical protein